MKNRKVIKRVSNRRYPIRYCKKQDCNEAFIPTDARQIYCCEQHRIDYNNDKRKIVDKIESDFTKKAKNNKSILIKILNSKEYIRDGVINISILQYEGYDFGIFHSIKIEEKTKKEMKFCYEYGVLLKDSENKNYIIYKQESI
ncbi:hypothetical protein ACSVH2_08525 [Flavobacterium sp. RSB2_4_14]|uniref:hypothetical protein n=1 Tax=Flavobacterium sp. RSB2_4_14 TaxID=3447665 RepID=UPI003F3AD121